MGSRVDKLSIQNEMACFDRKDRNFYDELTDEERKKFSTYLMGRWGSAVSGSRELQEFYVIATNERLNRHFFSVNRHPKLQWLMATAVSPDMGVHRHNWIAAKKKEKTPKNKIDVKKCLEAHFPSMKMHDIEAWARMITLEELQQFLKDHGD